MPEAVQPAVQGFSKPESEVVTDDEILEYLELQENNEADTLVSNLRDELEAELDGISKPRAVFTDEPGVPGSKLLARPLPITVERKHCTMSDEVDEVPMSDMEEEKPHQSDIQAVLERLERIEDRLEEWKDDQRGWMERMMVLRQMKNPGAGGLGAVGGSLQGLNYDTLKEWSKQSVKLPHPKGQSPRRQSEVTQGSNPELSAWRNTHHPAGHGAMAEFTAWKNAQDPLTERHGSSSSLGQEPEPNGSRMPESRQTRRSTSVNSFAKDTLGRSRTRESNVVSEELQDPTRSSRSRLHGDTRVLKAPGEESSSSIEPNGRRAAGGSTKATSVRNPDKPRILTSSTNTPPVRGGLVSVIVSKPAFDYFFASMIMLNSLFIGVQTEFRARMNRADEDPLFFDVVEQIFAYMFAVELLMRMGALKLAFFEKKTITWNVFDMVLVAMSFVEIILNATTPAAETDANNNNSNGNTSGTAGKVIRMFRMARIVRIMRVLRFLAELRIMVTLIMNSARSLFWLMILLLGILYVFSIFFTQGVTDFLRDAQNESNPLFESLQENYGNMVNSAYTLFASITGGVSWRDVLKPLGETGPGFTALFILYVFFCIFSVLNIVTGVFVDGAIQRSSQERDLRLEKEKEQKRMYIAMLTDLLEEIDVEGTNKIYREDLEEAFKSEQVKHYFSVLDIDVADSNYLFDMLDLDRSGEVDMNEFINGCLRLKGNAKSIDIHTLMYEIKLMIKQMSFFMEYFFQQQRKEP